MKLSKPARYGVLVLIFMLATALMILAVREFQVERRSVSAAARDKAPTVPAGPRDVGPTAPGTGATQAGKAVGASEETWLVQVEGAVVRPGVYSVKPGVRLQDVIEKAGGATPEGETSVFELAQPVPDGAKIYVCTKEEVRTGQLKPAAQRAISCLPGSASAGGSGTGGKRSINSAPASELEKVTGLGPTKARSIVEYRNKHGRFRSLNDLQNVDGIGPETLKKISPELTL